MCAGFEERVWDSRQEAATTSLCGLGAARPAGGARTSALLVPYPYKVENSQALRTKTAALEALPLLSADPSYCIRSAPECSSHAGGKARNRCHL